MKEQGRGLRPGDRDPATGGTIIMAIPFAEFARRVRNALAGTPEPSVHILPDAGPVEMAESMSEGFESRTTEQKLAWLSHIDTPEPASSFIEVNRTNLEYHGAADVDA